MFDDAQIVFTGGDDDVDLLESVRRNLSALYSTPEGTCPGDRSYGLDWSFLDYPLSVAQNMYAIEVIEKTEIFEPRAEVQEVKFAVSAEGTLMPTVSIGLRETDEENENYAEE